MSRKITCHICGKHLGEIRDATIRKGTVHPCFSCIETVRNDSRHDAKYTEFLSSVFGKLNGAKNAAK